MKAKIIRSFRDGKNKNEMQSTGGTWTGSKERFDEINKAAADSNQPLYLEAIEEEPKTLQKQGGKDRETKELKPKEETK